MTEFTVFEVKASFRVKETLSSNKLQTRTFPTSATHFERPSVQTKQRRSNGHFSKNEFRENASLLCGWRCFATDSDNGECQGYYLMS